MKTLRPSTPEESKIIHAIAQRAVALVANDHTTLDYVMDITAAHQDIPLKLEELLAADDTDFGHDVLGIRRYLNRQTLKIEDFFLPRYAQPE